MAVSRGPRIVTDGLICALNAGDKNSYPGTGTTWYDLSGNGNNGTLTGSPPLSSSFGGVFGLNGTSQYINVSGFNLTTGTSTVFCATRYAGGAIKGRMVNGLNNNWLIGQWASTTENFYAEGWVSAVSAGSNDSNWRIYAATNDTVADSYQIYVNAVNTTNSSTAGSQGPNGLSIGRYGPGGTEYSNGYISFVYVYNRVLSFSEIKINYDAFKYKFGL